MPSCQHAGRQRGAFSQITHLTNNRRVAGSSSPPAHKKLLDFSRIKEFFVIFFKKWAERNHAAARSRASKPLCCPFYKNQPRSLSISTNIRTFSALKPQAFYRFCTAVSGSVSSPFFRAVPERLIPPLNMGERAVERDQHITRADYGDCLKRTHNAPPT